MPTPEQRRGDGAGAPPSVWLLVDDRPGHRTQVVGLARWLGWPAEEKRLVFNPLNRLPNPLLGASTVSVVRAAGSELGPPFPDLLIGMGRRVVPVARRIRRNSGGRTVVVLLGRKAASDLREIDLTVACGHFRLLPQADLVELTVPPTQVDGEALTQARSAHGDPLAGLAHPRVLLLVGGPTAQHDFGAAVARDMAARVTAEVDALGGSLAIVTSRRTPADALAAMRAAAPQAHLHAWQAGRQANPYLAYLAAADMIVVTGESESMLAEAAAAGCPVTIYPLPARSPAAGQRIAGLIRQTAEGGGAGARLCRTLLARGWITPPRDLDMMHQLMVARGQASLFADGLNRTPPQPASERRHLVDRIVAVLEQRCGARP